MKKQFLILTALCALSSVTLSGCNKGSDTPKGAYKVAMITDYGDITDQSFNQTTYEGMVDWCTKNNIEKDYFKPANNSTEDRVRALDSAVERGYNVVIMPGFAFAETIVERAEEYPDVKFIALDVAKGDLLAAKFGKQYDYNPENPKWASYKLPENVYCAIYQEEISGYMAGYAAVKEGYTKLGFLGGMSVPAVVRFGYGFVQGCNDAAGGKDIELLYAYGNQFYGDATITARMDTWYQGGTEVVFACGGGIYTSACEAAGKVTPKGKVIGVDVDQAPIINKQYGAGTCITSATKGLYPTVQDTLQKLIIDGKFESKIETLGLVSATDVEANYVQLPLKKWALKKFTVDNYKALVADIYNKKITISNDTSKMPTVAATTKVTDQGNIK